MCGFNQANLLQEALNQAGFGSPTRGDGEKGRSPPDAYQVNYRVAVHGPIVIAGRSSLVEALCVQDAVTTNQAGGYMLVAQLDFVSSIDAVLHMRVAAIVTNSTVVERAKKGCEALLRFWKKL